jgi:hypothetical protein
MVFMFLSHAVAFAKNINAEMTLPTTLKNTLDKTAFLPIGETKFSILFWDLYKSQLMTTTGNYPVMLNDDESKDDLLYEINYLADISSKDLIRRTVDQWEHLDLSPDAYKAYLPALEAIWPDIKEGDHLSLLIHKGQSVFYFNQTFIGTINSSEFGPMFLDIWLSEKTSQPKLRDELLGMSSDE